MNDIFWIKGDPLATLAIVLRPRGDAMLESELLRLKRNGIQTLVSLLEHLEADTLGLADEGPAAVHVGLHFLVPANLRMCSDENGFLPALCCRAGESSPRRRIGWRPLPGKHRQVNHRCGLHSHSSGLAARDGTGGH